MFTSRKGNAQAGDLGGVRGNDANSVLFCLYCTRVGSFCQIRGLGHILRLRDKAISLGHDSIRRELERLAIRKLAGGVR